MLSHKDLDVTPSYSPTHSQVKYSTSISLSHEPSPNALILAHSDQMINQEQPANIDPLNAMDEDLLEEPNANDYEDSQDIMLDEEDMGDTFLDLEHIQDLELSMESSKRCKVEKGDEGLLKLLTNPVSMVFCVPGRRL